MKYKIRTLSIAMAAILLFSMVAATSVSAAPWSVTASSTVKAPIVGTPAVVIDTAAGLYYWAVQGTPDVKGNTVYWQSSPDGPNSPGSWSPLGTGTNPSIVYLGAAGNVAVFARGTNGQIWGKQTTNGGTTWSNVGLPTSTAAAGTGPVAVSPNTNEIHVFYVNSGTNHLMWDAVLPTATTLQTDLGGIVFATPAAAITSTGGDVIVKGTGGVIYQKTYALGGFGPWTKFHDGLIGAGASLASDGGALYLSVVGTNSRLYMAESLDGGVTWTTKWDLGLSLFNNGALYWANQGGVCASGPSSGLALSGSVITPVRGGDGNIWVNFAIVPAPIGQAGWLGPYQGP